MGTASTGLGGFDGLATRWPKLFLMPGAPEGIESNPWRRFTLSALALIDASGTLVDYYHERVQQAGHHSGFQSGKRLSIPQLDNKTWREPQFRKRSHPALGKRRMATTTQDHGAVAATLWGEAFEGGATSVRCLKETWQEEPLNGSRRQKEDHLGELAEAHAAAPKATKVSGRIGAGVTSYRALVQDLYNVQ